MFTNEELIVLKQALNVLPIQANVENLMSGQLRVSPLIENLIIKLTNMQEETTEEVKGTDAPEAEVA